MWAVAGRGAARMACDLADAGVARGRVRVRVRVRDRVRVADLCEAVPADGVGEGWP